MQSTHSSTGYRDVRAKGLRSVVAVRQNLDGEVLDVQVHDTSGSPALDQSLIAALWNASPLPLPCDALSANEVASGWNAGVT